MSGASAPKVRASSASPSPRWKVPVSSSCTLSSQSKCSSSQRDGSGRPRSRPSRPRMISRTLPNRGSRASSSPKRSIRAASSWTCGSEGLRRGGWLRCCSDTARPYLGWKDGLLELQLARRQGFKVAFGKCRGRIVPRDLFPAVRCAFTNVFLVGCCCFGEFFVHAGLNRDEGRPALQPPIAPDFIVVGAARRRKAEDARDVAHHGGGRVDQGGAFARAFGVRKPVVQVRRGGAERRGKILPVGMTRKLSRQPERLTAFGPDHVACRGSPAQTASAPWLRPHESKYWSSPSAPARRPQNLKFKNRILNSTGSQFEAVFGSRSNRRLERARTRTLERRLKFKDIPYISIGYGGAPGAHGNTGKPQITWRHPCCVSLSPT